MKTVRRRVEQRRDVSLSRICLAQKSCNKCVRHIEIIRLFIYCGRVPSAHLVCTFISSFPRASLSLITGTEPVPSAACPPCSRSSYITYLTVHRLHFDVISFVRHPPLSQVYFSLSDFIPCWEEKPPLPHCLHCLYPLSSLCHVCVHGSNSSQSVCFTIEIFAM